MLKYSFLLPAYKSLFLNEALRSIQKQTYQEFKVVISDDCSSECIREICEPYLNDSRFSYRRNKSNMGGKSLVSHWNLLVSLCDTEYFIMASDDDLYDSCFLETIDSLISKYPDMDLYRARVCRINEEGTCFEVERPTEIVENQISFVDSLFSPYQIHCIGNYIFKTKSLVDKGSFIDFPSAWFSDDATVILCSENGVANTNDTLFCFRKSLINISNSRTIDRMVAKKKIIACCQFYDWMKNYIISHDSSLFSNTQLKRIKNNYHQRVYDMVSGYSYQLDVKSLWTLLKWMKSSGLESNILKRFVFVVKWLKHLV